ncbi:putative T7SS-secreted protein [Streptomyces axinellae]|uniref:Putative T7SS secretion signal domain-containing protein n=1 Tax=Streptomyces axinellae TaxID=552788 RepID=A0ABN3QFF0_9ACTN
MGKGALKGRAADAFWEKVGLEPVKWVKAADACEKAAGALEDFAGTVEWAQGQAGEAVAKYKDDKKKAAQEQLDEARSQRDEAAGRARTAVRAARDAAPPKASYPPDVRPLRRISTTAPSTTNSTRWAAWSGG